METQANHSLDASDRQRLLTFSEASSKDLHKDCYANLSIHIALSHLTFLPPDSSGWLKALDKCSVVRPIKIGEDFR